MAGPTQPESPTLGDTGDDSGPHTAQKDTEIRDAPSDKEFRQIFEEQEVGKFDFDSDFGVIKNEADFKRRLWEYERMMDDESKSPTDFPLDPKIQRRFVRRVAEAMLNMEGATDKKIKDRKRPSKYEAYVPGDKDSGDKEKDSVAVNFLNGLKLVEVELLSWKIVTISRDVQEGQLSRGTYGSEKTKIKQFGSWTERIESIIECLKTTKSIARAIIQQGDLRMRDFVADPETMKVKHNDIRIKNIQRAEARDAANKAKGAVLREEKSQFHSPSGAQNILAGTGSPQIETTLNSLESSRAKDGGDIQDDVESSSLIAEQQEEPSATPSVFNGFVPGSVNKYSSPPTLPTRPSSMGYTGPGQSSRAPIANLSAATSSSPSARKPLPSFAPQRPPTSGFPSYPGEAFFQGGISGGPGSRASASKRSHLLSQPQEDYSPGTRGVNASGTQKRQKLSPTRGEGDLNAYDMKRHEDDNYDENEEE